MRTSDSRAGFTLVEAIVVVAILGLLVSMVWPAKTLPRKPLSLRCRNNLRLIGSAYRVWASDNGDRFSAAVPRSEGGWRDFLTNGKAGPYCWTNYAVMANELGQAPRVLICPGDIRKPATKFSSMANRNVSYFVGVSASGAYPQSILGGDRNLSPGYKPRDDFGFSLEADGGNDVVLQTNSTSSNCWSLKMHSAGRGTGAGNILFADGSVRLLVTSATFRKEIQPNAGVPKLEDLTNSPGQLPPPGADFRLVFP